MTTDDKPKKPDFGDEDSGIEVEPKVNRFELPSGYAIYAVILVIALAVSYLMNMFIGVPKSDYDARMLEMAEAIAAVQSDMRASKDSIKLALDNIPITVENEINKSINNLTARLNSFELDIKALQDDIQTAINKGQSALNQTENMGGIVESLKASVNTWASEINAIKEELGQLAANDGYAELRDDLDDAIGKIASLETSIATLSKQVTDLIGGGGGGATTPDTGVVATIVGTNPMPLIAGTNTINISLTNHAPKAVYAEQLRLQLQFLNPPSAINTWGLTLSSGYATVGTPSYSVVSGMVTYILNASVYLSTNTSQTISVVVNCTSPPVGTVNFIAMLEVVSFSQLP